MHQLHTARCTIATRKLHPETRGVLLERDARQTRNAQLSLCPMRECSGSHACTSYQRSLNTARRDTMHLQSIRKRIETRIGCRIGCLAHVPQTGPY